MLAARERVTPSQRRGINTGSALPCPARADDRAAWLRGAPRAARRGGRGAPGRHACGLPRKGRGAGERGRLQGEPLVSGRGGSARRLPCSGRSCPAQPGLGPAAAAPRGSHGGGGAGRRPRAPAAASG